MTNAIEIEIEDEVALTKFEAMPTERTLYLSAIRYKTGSWWCGGPTGDDKDAVLASIQNWPGIDRARIYTVKVPIEEVAP